MGPFLNRDIDALGCAKVRGLNVISIAPIQRTISFAGGLYRGSSGGVVVNAEGRAVAIHLESRNSTKTASEISSTLKSDRDASVDASLESLSNCHASIIHCAIIALHGDIQSYLDV